MTYMVSAVRIIALSGVALLAGLFIDQQEYNTLSFDSVASSTVSAQEELIEASEAASLDSGSADSFENTIEQATSSESIQESSATSTSDDSEASDGVDVSSLPSLNVEETVEQPEQLIASSTTPQQEDVPQEEILDLEMLPYIPESIEDCLMGEGRKWFFSPGECIEVFRSL